MAFSANVDPCCFAVFSTGNAGDKVATACMDSAFFGDCHSRCQLNGHGPPTFFANCDVRSMSIIIDKTGGRGPINYNEYTRGTFP